jgi:hypothetical protein
VIGYAVKTGESGAATLVQSVRIRQELHDPEKLPACNRVCKTVKLFVVGCFLEGPLNYMTAQ